MIPAASASVGSVGLDKYNNNNRGLENSSKSSKSVGNAADSTSSIPRSQAQNKTVNASVNPFATAVVGIAASKEIESKSQESVKSHNNVTLADSKPNSTSLHPSPPNLDAQSSTVRWTNAGIDNGAIGQAMVVPIVVAQDDNDVNTNKEPKSSRAISHQSLAPNSEQVEPSSVRWTNYSTSGALGTTRIDNSTMSMYSDHFSIYNPLGDNLAPLQDPISEGFASDPDFSRWTNSGLDQDHGKLDEEKNNKNQENSRQPFVEKDKESEDDEDDQKERRSTGVSSYQAGLDHTSMVWREDLDTLFRNSQNSYSGFQGIGQTDGENNSDSESDSEQKMASAASGKKANIYNQTPQQEPSRKSPLMDIMAASEANKTKQVNDSPKKVLDGEIISSSAFDVDSARNSTRWSNIAGLPPINTSFTGPLEHLTPKSAASLESPSLRWKVAQIASPVETAHAPIVTESFADIHNVTDQPDALYDSESDSEFGDIPSTVNPVKARMVSAVNLAKPSGAEINPVRAEKSPIGTSGSSGAKNVSKTPSVLSPLSGQMFSPTSTGPHTQMGALDGRAASRRMVEEYFSTRESIIPAPAPPPPTDKKIKHRSDFRSVMEMAIINNKDGRPPSEDHPHLYYAKFDFNAREVGELGFDKGDPVIVVDSSDDIWWVGYKDGGK
ncbi:hypothetical protein CLU79DRAFT_364950 [Phycomyces nitens]|nr:hypothetical protein CLU79DRAFT_364950 [Phycomyces nitens]